MSFPCTRGLQACGLKRGAGAEAFCKGVRKRAGDARAGEKAQEVATKALSGGWTAREVRAKAQVLCSKRCSNLAACWRNPAVYRQKRLESYHRQKA